MAEKIGRSKMILRKYYRDHAPEMLAEAILLAAQPSRSNSRQSRDPSPSPPPHLPDLIPSAAGYASAKGDVISYQPIVPEQFQFAAQANDRPASAEPPNAPMLDTVSPPLKMPRLGGEQVDDLDAARGFKIQNPFPNPK
jgi:hypothetical protein